MSEHESRNFEGTIGSAGPDVSARAFWTRLLVLAAAVTLARLVYLAFFCPYTLVGDEAHYWEWSRRLDLSYYTKGPGIAWTIAAGTKLFGDTEFGVRLFAPIASGALAVLTGVLGASATGRRRAGLYAAGCVLLAPIFQSLAVLMTIDGPYAALWAAAGLAGWWAIGKGNAAGWAVMGLCVGLGCLYKYTALLVLPGPIAVYLWNRRAIGHAGRHVLGMIAGVALFLIATAPITIWNMREGWPTITHLLGHLHVKGGDTQVTQGSGKGWHYSPLWTINFVAGQVGLVGPVLVLAMAEVWRTLRARRARENSGGTSDGPARGEAYLLATAMPILVFYLAVSVFRQPEGNWPLAGYLTLFGLAGRRLETGMAEWRQKLAAWRALPSPRPWQGVFVRRPETFTQVCWHLAMGIGIGMALATLRMDLIKKLPLVGPLLPLHRFTGGDVVARDAERMLAQIKAETDKEPFVLSTHYGRASQLAFYMKGHPTVYCCQGFMPDGRRTQYDFFADTDLRRENVTELLRGRPALVLEVWPHHDFSAVFGTMRTMERLAGTSSQNKPTTWATDYRGFPPGLLPRRDETQNSGSTGSGD